MKNVNIIVSHMITRIHESRLEQNVYHENININLIVQSVIQIKNEIKNFAHVSSKVLGTITCVQKDYV